MISKHNEWLRRAIVLPGLILFIALVVIFARSHIQSPLPSTVAERPIAAPARIDPRIEAAVDEMISKGVFRVDRSLRRAWISSDAWSGIDAQTKELVTRALAIYVSPANPMVTIYDAQSARELASYGPFQGFSAK